MMGGFERLTAPTMTHSLDRLSDRERDLLTLLAQGHTAKTIARSRALSVNVVNEHLRSARRKTDAPSSRELARIVAAEATAVPQENEDKLFGIEGPTTSTDRRLQRGVAIGARTASNTWRFAMILAVLIAAGLLAYQTSQTESYRLGDGSSQASTASAPPDLIYQVTFLKNGEYLASPTVVGQFGREVRVEIPDTLRVVMIAEAPDQDGRSLTSIRMSVFADGVWGAFKEMSGNLILSATPSFEYSVEGTPYRFVVLPRLIVPAAG